jgi:hypothetical protein
MARRPAPSNSNLELHEQQEASAVVRRFSELTPRAQLEAFELIRAYVGSGVKETAADREIDQRKAALEALRQVAEELGLPAGQAPTTTQFAEAAKRLELDWSVSKVGRAWGRWRFACEAFTGYRLRRTARQQGVLDAGKRRRRVYEDYTAALRLWLSTEPLAETIKAYDAWAREFNDALVDGQKPVRHWGPTQAALKVGFADALRLARGETTLAAVQREPDHPDDFGPLVSTGWIARERGLSIFMARETSLKPDFPKAVALLSGTRVWLKDDVQAHFAGRPFPQREEFELQDAYLSRRKLAALLGKRPETFSQTTRLPEPAGMVSRKRYWRRDEAEGWSARRKRGPAA